MTAIAKSKKRYKVLEHAAVETVRINRQQYNTSNRKARHRTRAATRNHLLTRFQNESNGTMDHSPTAYYPDGYHFDLCNDSLLYLLHDLDEGVRTLQEELEDMVNQSEHLHRHFWNSVFPDFLASAADSASPSTAQDSDVEMTSPSTSINCQPCYSYDHEMTDADSNATDEQPTHFSPTSPLSMSLVSDSDTDTDTDISTTIDPLPPSNHNDLNPTAPPFHPRATPAQATFLTNLIHLGNRHQLLLHQLSLLRSLTTRTLARLHASATIPRLVPAFIWPDDAASFSRGQCVMDITGTVLQMRDEDDVRCAICTDGYERWDRMALLECGHRFCEMCVTMWFEGQERIGGKGGLSCPMCRREFVWVLRGQVEG